MTRRYLAILSLLAFAGCALGGQTPFGSGGGLPSMRSDNVLRSLSATGAGKITHVVYIVQENRSFNNLFQGYPGAYTVPTGKNSYGDTITLQPVTLETVYEVDHSAQAMFAACNGTGSHTLTWRMSGSSATTCSSRTSTRVLSRTNT